MAGKADTDPKQVPIAGPEHDKILQVRAHLVNLAHRFGDRAFEGATADIPGVTRLLEYERRAVVHEAATARITEIVDRSGALTSRSSSAIRADFELSLSELGAIEAFLENKGIIVEDPNDGWVSAVAAQEEAEFQRTATPESRAQRKFAKEQAEFERAIEVVLQQVEGRYGTSVTDFKKHLAREYPDVSEDMVNRAFDSLAHRRFGVNERDELYEFKGWK